MLLVVASLTLAFCFEAVNGFHDTANAVATVIYTRSLRPTTAVVWSGLCNMAGILLGGIGVAFSIVHLLPVDLLVNVHTNAGLAMILSLLLSALLWNFGTWYLGLPASSSHALIGSIIGVGMANAWLAGHGVLAGMNLPKVGQVGMSLLLSPLIGFGLSACLLLFLKRTKAQPVLDKAPGKRDGPPLWVRGILCLTCTGVSLAHGSNDGQKGMGLVMLILIGLLPAHFALNLEQPGNARHAVKTAARMERMLDRAFAARSPNTGFVTVAHDIPHPDYVEAKFLLGNVASRVGGRSDFAELTPPQRWELRQDLLHLDRTLKELEPLAVRNPQDQSQYRSLRKSLRMSIEYVPTWVIIGVALALGLGTMVGWKRIVVTVGEKIGKSHLTYGQGASAELIAMTTIGLADVAGLPVSTTHVLSSGVAGTMWANRSGINGGTARNILLAWLLTLPATILLSAGLFTLARLLFPA